MSIRLFTRLAAVTVAVLLLFANCSTDGGPKKECRYIYVNNTASNVIVEMYDTYDATVPSDTYCIEPNNSITFVSYYSAFEHYLKEPFWNIAYLKVYVNDIMTEYQQNYDLHQKSLYNMRSYVEVDDNTYIWVFE